MSYGVSILLSKSTTPVVSYLVFWVSLILLLSFYGLANPQMHVQIVLNLSLQIGGLNFCFHQMP